MPGRYVGCGQLPRGLSREKPADFIHKLGIVEEEADESIFWLEFIVRAKILPEARLAPLIAEANEILSLVVASINTAKRNRP